MSNLEVKNVSKTLGNKTILKNISFSVAKQQVVGIIGPNGAGKSTLLKVLSGLSTPSDGTILLDNLCIHTFSEEIRNKIGYLIESPALYDELTGYDNLMFCLRLHGLKYNSYLDIVCNKLNIQRYLNEKVKKYSQGMKQRLGIACALVHNPDILILDEPTNCLDINGIKEIRDFISFIKHQGKSVIISSHMLNEIEEICDSSIIISNGSIVDIVNSSTQLNDLNQNYIITLENKEDISSIINNYQFITGDNNIKVKIKSNEINNIIKLLTENHIAISDIEKEGHKLEKHFLEKVGNFND